MFQTFSFKGRTIKLFYSNQTLVPAYVLTDSLDTWHVSNAFQNVSFLPKLG